MQKGELSSYRRSWKERGSWEKGIEPELASSNETRGVEPDHLASDLQWNQDGLVIRVREVWKSLKTKKVWERLETQLKSANPIVQEMDREGV